MFFGTLNYGESPPCYLFLLFRTFYASIFYYKIDSLEKYRLATDIATSFTCPNITQENLVFIVFLWPRTP